MALGGEVDDGVATGHRSFDHLAVGDVAANELDSILEPREVGGIARVGQCVVDDDLPVWILVADHPDVV